MFDSLSEKIADAVKNMSGKGKISEKNIEDTIKEVRTALLEADVNFKVVKEFVNKVKEKALGEDVFKGVEPGEQFIKIMHDELADLMGQNHEELNLDRKKPIPVLIVGLNGAGKTTFSGKFANFLRKKYQKSSVLVPADTFRPAAKDQLQTLAKSLEVPCLDTDLSKHPKDLALEGIKFAEENHLDVAIIDTAGRLHVDENLMQQIREVRDAIGDREPEVFLVADAMTGQEAVNVAKSFHEVVGLTGCVLSKMDSDARGGAALSIKHVTGVPIKFFSTGEKMDDLEAFHPDRLAKRILDMGDVLTLVEKAEEAIDEKKAEKMMKNLEKNKFTIDDFMEQMGSMKKLGSMESILKMIPGMGGVLRQMGDLSPAENEMQKMQVIINSMTKSERQNDKLLNNDSRVDRIAKGSGTSKKEVNDFLTKFRQMRKMMSGMMGMMKGGMLGGLGDLFGGGGLPGGLPGMGGESQAGFRQKKRKGKGKKGKRNPGGFPRFK